MLKKLFHLDSIDINRFLALFNLYFWKLRLPIDEVVLLLKCNDDKPKTGENTIS